MFKYPICFCKKKFINLERLTKILGLNTTTIVNDIFVRLINYCLQYQFMRIREMYTELLIVNSTSTKDEVYWGEKKKFKFIFC